jgi:hypothetical protein
MGQIVGIAGERPRLVIEAPFIQSVSFTSPSVTLTTRASAASMSTPINPLDTNEFDVAYLHISNKPKRGSTTAQSVQLELRFSRGDEILYEIAARWSDTSQSVGYESTQTPHQRDLSPNGLRHRFDIAAKFPNTDQCYAVNDENRYIGWEARPLGKNPVTVEVTAQGANVETLISRWRLTHDGIEGSLHLEPTSGSTTRIGRVALRASRRIQERWG